MKFFTQDHARNIAAKLKMEVKPGRKHDLAIFRHDGREIAQFGIRRGSGELPHSYIPQQLHLTKKQCRELHDCHISLEQFVEHLKAKGLVQPGGPAKS